MKTNLYKLIKYINDYSSKEGKCPSHHEISIAINMGSNKVGSLIRSAYVVGMLKPIKALNRKGSKRTERNWKLTDQGKEYLKLVVA